MPLPRRWATAAIAGSASSPDETFETLKACHELAFEALGGCPREILYDNAKTIVLKRDLYGPGLHRWHPGFLDLAKQYGVLPRLCRPYRARTKGKIERFHRYLKENFYVPLSSRLKACGLLVDVDTANAEVSRWLREVANQRIHALTGEAPAVRFESERPLLRPLPGFSRKASTPSRPMPLAVPILTTLQHPLSVYQQLLTATDP